MVGSKVVTEQEDPRRPRQSGPRRAEAGPAGGEPALAPRAHAACSRHGKCTCTAERARRAGTRRLTGGVRLPV